MIIKNAQFIGSYPSVVQGPKESLPEYAFIGRSNVGKSSLINMLLGRKNLARTSNTPGKTQLLNYYLINESWYIVDLPGYGYAKISKVKRREWEKMIRQYLRMRNTLVTSFVLIDSNIPPQKIDIDFVNWLGEMQVPFVIIYTKTDKSLPVQIENNITAFRRALADSWDSLPTQFLTSSRVKKGGTEILKFIDDLNKSLVE